MTQQPAGQPRLSPEDQETAVLLSLAYLGQLTLAQLARLLLASERTVQRRLTQDPDSLAKRGLVARVDRAEGSDTSGMPSRGVAWWRLTEEGQRSIRGHAQAPSNVLGRDEQYPARPASVRRGRLQHDSLVAETVVCLVEAARERGGLSGVFARLEIKANPFHSAPWADALVVCHTDLAQPCPHPIPWTRDLPTGGEQDWVFLVELDRATEPLATIGAKAREYVTMLADPRWQRHWEERFGPGRRPRILWVVPDERRSAQVQRVWQEAWPEGRWYISTFEELRSSFWQRVEGGQRMPVQFFAPPRTAPAASPPTAQEAPPTLPGSPAQALAPPLPATMRAATISDMQVALFLTAPDNIRSPNDIRVQLLDAAREVFAEARTRSGRAALPAPRPDAPVRIRLPDLQVELSLDAAGASLELRLPELPPAPQPSPAPQRVEAPPPGTWGSSGMTQAIDRVYDACGVFARRVNEHCDARMQEASYGGSRALLTGLLFAYLCIFPVALGTLGQALCVLLRGLLRLAQALGWALGTVWECAWGRPAQPVRAGLARLLLALALVVWLPLASWGYYDRELRSWPCQALGELHSMWVAAEPSVEAEAIIVPPGAAIHCFTRTVTSAGNTWRRVQVGGREAWALTWMLEEGR